MTWSRAVLATIEAAAIEATAARRPAPRTGGHARPAGTVAVDQRQVGRAGSPATARHRQVRGAQDVELVDLGDAGMGDRDHGRAPDRRVRASRRFAVTCLESFSPSGMRTGSRITAAAVTGPASGPRPTSSIPAMRAMPRAPCASRLDIEASGLPCGQQSMPGPQMQREGREAPPLLPVRLPVAQ